MSTAAGIGRVRQRRSVLRAGMPSGSAGADTVAAELQAGDPLRCRVPRRAAFDRHGAPVHLEIGGELHLAVVRLRQRRMSDRADRRYRRHPAQHDLDIVELDRTRRADVECLEQPMHRVENRDRRNRSGSISPSRVLQGAPSSRIRREPNACGKDAGIADPGRCRAGCCRTAAAARGCRNRWCLASRTGEPSVFGLEADVGNLDGQQLRAVERHARRSKHGVDVDARKAADRGFGFVAAAARC